MTSVAAAVSSSQPVSTEASHLKSGASRLSFPSTSKSSSLSSSNLTLKEASTSSMTQHRHLNPSSLSASGSKLAYKVAPTRVTAAAATSSVPTNKENSDSRQSSAPKRVLVSSSLKCKRGIGLEKTPALGNRPTISRHDAPKGAVVHSAPPTSSTTDPVYDAAPFRDSSKDASLQLQPPSQTNSIVSCDENLVATSSSASSVSSLPPLEQQQQLRTLPPPSPPHTAMVNYTEDQVTELETRLIQWKFLNAVMESEFDLVKQGNHVCINAIHLMKNKIIGG